MNENKAYSGVVGLEIVLTFEDENGLPIDLTPVTTEVEVKMSRPGGVVTYPDSEMTVFSPDGNMVRFFTEAGDVATAGTYRVQGWVTIPGFGVYPSDIVSFDVAHSI